MPRTIRSMARRLTLSAAGAMLLASAGCMWPVRSRAFYRLDPEGDKSAKVAGSGDYMFERCRGTFMHPVLEGHCFLVTVRSDLVAEGREVRFPGDGASAVLMPVEFSQKRPTTPAVGWVRFRRVGPERIVADIEVSGRSRVDGKAYWLRDRVGFRATALGAEPFFHF